MLNRLRSTLLRRKLPVVFEQQVDKEDLDLICCKEPSGAGVRAVAESKVFRARRDELVSVLVAGFLAFVVEAVAIEALRIGVNGFVLHDVARNHHAGAFGNDCSVREWDFSCRYPMDEGCGV